MKKIYKYPLDLNSSSLTVVRMPLKAKLLSIQRQGPDGPACIWAMIDDKDELVERAFMMYGTGYDFEDGIGFVKFKSEQPFNGGVVNVQSYEIRYGIVGVKEPDFIGTVQFGDGALVMHVFEIFTR